MKKDSPTRLFLVRHGEVDGAGEALHGHVDVPLTVRGTAQMEGAAAFLAREPLCAVYASDLQRARVGAEVVARVHGLDPVVDPALRELDMGAWDGRPMADLWAEHRRELEAWWTDLEGFRLPGGESLADLRARVQPALDRALARHRGRTLCVVAHGGVNRVVLFAAMGLPLQQFHRVAQDYGCVNRIDYYPDGRVVVGCVNAVPALG